MSYTKRNLNTITILLAIVTFICVYLISSQFSLLYSYYNHPKKVYSKTIPIQKQSKEVHTILTTDNIANNLIGYINTMETNKTVSTLELEMEQVQKAQEQIKKEYHTQRQVLQANKENSWRIQIPRLGIDVHIQEGTTQAVLLKAVGHFEGTTTWNGNVCLAGHNRGYLCNFFQKIKNLQIGDEIIYCTKQGKRVYKVRTNTVILSTDWRYIEETKDNRITLITCEENRGEYRRCVQAMQVAEYLK